VHFIRRIGGKTAGGFTLRIGFDFRPAAEYIYSTSQPKIQPTLVQSKIPYFSSVFASGNSLKSRLHQTSSVYPLAAVLYFLPMQNLLNLRMFGILITIRAKIITINSRKLLTFDMKRLIMIIEDRH
jgi:hypothetical protein